MSEEKRKKTGISALALGRADTYQVDPRVLKVKEGWNSRDRDFDPEDEDDLRLARSIAEVGVKETMTVIYEDGEIFVTNGHRRRAAALYAIEHLGAEIKSVPVKTEDRFASEADRVLSQIVRNDGKKLSPLETARVIKKLLDLGWSLTAISKKTGFSDNWINQLLGLHAAPEEVKALVKDGTVSATLAAKVVKDAEKPSEAAETLTKAVSAAKERGKGRATARDVRDLIGKPERKPKAEKPAATVPTVKVAMPTREAIAAAIGDTKLPHDGGEITVRGMLPGFVEDEEAHLLALADAVLTLFEV